MGYEYETVSDRFISNKLHESVISHLYNPCYNLSSVLGDLDGKLNPTTTKQVISSVTIVAPGIVLSGYTDASEDIEDEFLGKDTYINEVTTSAYNLYSKFVSNDPSVVILGSSNTHVTSPLINLSLNQAPLVKTAICSLYVDTMALYLELLNSDSTKNIPITKQDLQRMDGNIRWITANLEDTEYRSYDLIEVIRELQRNLMFIRSINQIFTTTYSNKLSGMSNIEGV